jgi:hypothetical protein
MIEKVNTIHITFTRELTRSALDVKLSDNGKLKVALIVESYGSLNPYHEYAAAHETLALHLASNSSMDVTVIYASTFGKILFESVVEASRKRNITLKRYPCVLRLIQGLSETM